MPNLFRSIFSNTPKFVPGHKVAHTKTVGGVLGSNFDYLGSIHASSTFCKKLLKWCAKESSTENILFLLMCEKYRKNPSSALFNEIYSEFIGPSAPRQLNISGKTAVELTTLWKLGDPGSSGLVFDAAAKDARANASDSIMRLSSASFETAFTLTTSHEKQQLESALAYLRSHQINLI